MSADYYYQFDEPKGKFKTFVSNHKKKIIIFVSLFIVVFGFFLYLHTPPSGFPVGQVVTVYPGESLQQITNTLHDANIIRSPIIFRSTVILLGGEKKVMAGDYLLDTKEGPVDLAYRLVNGKYHIKVAKITIPEGWNVFQIADYLQNNLINFDKQKFLSLARKEEGYLFPDTYFMSPAIKLESIIEIMKNNFEARIKKIPELSESKYELEDIINMASILEAEARTTESRRIIAGILWKRIQIGMPLQVDSTFSYVNGKNTYELTLSDLKIDSPYNTYEYGGLPPGPINNPGIDSIVAAATPISTKYLYFLSSRSGDMYYAQTFEQHKKNKELYLNK